MRPFGPGPPGVERPRWAAALLLAVALAACTSGPPAEPDADGAAPDRAAPLPEPRTEVAGAAWQGRVVVAGGLRADGTTSARADWWDPATDTWSALPDLPVPLHHTALVSTGDRLWLIGGYVTTEGGWAPELRTWWLESDGEPWQPGPDLLLARGAPAAVATASTVWVLGGVGDAGTQVATEWLGEEGWEPGPSLVAPREHLAAVVVDGQPMAVGGRDGGLATTLLSTEVVDEAEGAVPGPELTVPRGGFGGATLGGVPCVAGGELAGGTVAQVECLVDEAWQVVGALDEPRHGLAVVALGDDLHVIGGGPEPGLSVSDAHEVLPLEALLPSG